MWRSQKQPGIFSARSSMLKRNRCGLFISGPPAILRPAAVMHEGQDTTPAHFISAPLHGLLGTDRWGLNSKLSGRPMAPRGRSRLLRRDACRDGWCLDKCCSQCHIIQWELAAGRSGCCSNYLLSVRGVGLIGSVFECVGGSKGEAESSFVAFF